MADDLTAQLTRAMASMARALDALSAEAAGRSEPTKVAQSKVNYRQHAADPGRSCGTCRYFLPVTQECELVAGRIEAEGVCDLWAERTVRAKRIMVGPGPGGQAY